MTRDERVTLLAWDDAGGMFLRAEVTAGGAVATAAVLVWVGARPVYAYGLAVEASEAGAGLVVGGLRLPDAAGATTWTLELDDGPNTMSLRFEPITAPWPDGAPSPLADEHDERACRVTGRLEVSGHAIDVDGVGQRRRSIGAAPVDAPAGWRSVTGYLGPSSRPVGAPATEVAFQVWEVGPTAAGFIHAAGTDHPVETAAALDDDPLHLELTDAGGRRFTVRGHRHGLEVPVRPAGADAASTAVLHLQLVRWEADGLDGYGLVERLDEVGAPPTGE